jgi:hypothetical protein
MIAAYAAMRNNIDRIDFTEVSRLTVDEAVRVKRFMTTEPSHDYKFALIDLDSASKAAMDKLLITLENPAPHAKYSLISSTGVPRTLRTRANNFVVGFLQPDQLLTILLNKGIPEREARTFASLGRVDLALAAYENMASVNIAVNVLEAVESTDHILFMQSYKAVDQKVAQMILTALEESAAQSWKIFNPEHLGAFAKRNVALKLLGIWSTVSSARPELAIRVTLESVMRS